MLRPLVLVFRPRPRARPGLRMCRGRARRLRLRLWRAASISTSIAGNLRGRRKCSGVRSSSAAATSAGSIVPESYGHRSLLEACCARGRTHSVGLRLRRARTKHTKGEMDLRRVVFSRWVNDRRAARHSSFVSFVCFVVPSAPSRMTPCFPAQSGKKGGWPAVRVFVRGEDFGELLSTAETRSDAAIR